MAQPAIATASRAALCALEALGIEAQVAVGHSVGELAALHWAGQYDEAALLRIAAARGRLMAEHAEGGGAMAGIGAPADQVQTLLQDGAVIACMNGPAQTVVAGRTNALEALCEKAQAKSWQARMLPVSHAFHSPLMAPVGAVLGEHLNSECFVSLARRVVSTITGEALRDDQDIKALLVEQLTKPVRFTDAITNADADVDLWIEAGPGCVLCGLLQSQSDTPAVALDAGGSSLRGLHEAAAAAFVRGVPLRHEALFEDRFTRPFDLNWKPSFFVNPCELAPLPDGSILGVLGEEGNDDDDLASTNADGDSPAADASALQVMRQLVAEHLELPVETVLAESQLLTDLHLNSIAVGQLVAQAARRLALSPPQSPTEFANATVGQVAEVLEQLEQTGAPEQEEETERVPAGVDHWVRPFVVRWTPHPIQKSPATADASGSSAWQCFADEKDAFALKLRDALAERTTGGGVLVCMPPDTDERSIDLLLRGAKAAMEPRDQVLYLLVQQNGRGVPGAGFAKTLHLEAPHVRACVVDVPQFGADAIKWVVDEAVAAAAANGFIHARYDDSGARCEPVLKLLHLDPDESDEPIGSDDVLLVTGGGKGIAAESVLTLAKNTGVKLVLMGRSDPGEDDELDANLKRMRDEGVRLEYCRADVSDAEQVRRAVVQAQSALGTITAVLHGAGTNVPSLIAALDEQAFGRTLAPKVQGVLNVLKAIDTARLKLFVTFSSIIGRIGLVGEADYALANEWLTQITEQFAAEHPQCRCVAVESSVWSGVGMGQRLGRVEALLKEGITPISPDDGVSALCNLIRHRLPVPAVVVTGRFGQPPTMRLEATPLPLLRFIEQPRVHYPGVELVIDVSLSGDTDPYVNDHVYDRQPLFPAVMGLEAMAQTAAALSNGQGLPSFESVEFHRPVVVPPEGGQTIRLAAVLHENGRVEVSLRSAETGFSTDHFRAVCVFGRRHEGTKARRHEGAGAEDDGAAHGEQNAIDPDRDPTDDPNLETLRAFVPSCLRDARTPHRTRPRRRPLRQRHALPSGPLPPSERVSAAQCHRMRGRHRGGRPVRVVQSLPGR